ncbi:MAG: hypothetical protein PHW72_00440 [Candidatus Pacebacteria bacterium]|nr:hypothetical protein [Candidatus Paceibacterota bacterium]
MIYEAGVINPFIASEDEEGVGEEISEETTNFEEDETEGEGESAELDEDFPSEEEEEEGSSELEE